MMAAREGAGGIRRGEKNARRASSSFSARKEIFLKLAPTMRAQFGWYRVNVVNGNSVNLLGNSIRLFGLWLIFVKLMARLFVTADLYNAD